MSYSGTCSGTTRGHYYGCVGAAPRKAGIFSGAAAGIFAGDLQKAALAKSKATTAAKGKSADRTACAKQAAAELEMSYANFMSALSDPAVAAWFNAYCAARTAGVPLPAPPASIKEAAVAAVSAEGMPFLAKIALGATAAAAVVGVGVAITRKKGA